LTIALFQNDYLFDITDERFLRSKKIQTDIDDLKFDQENEKKMVRKKGLELDCIERAKSAAKEVRKRTLEASKAADNLDDDDDDVVSVRQEIDHTLYGIQTFHFPPSRKVLTAKKWSSRPGHWHDIVIHMK
jgi:hypothetical protein